MYNWKEPVKTTIASDTETAVAEKVVCTGRRRCVHKWLQELRPHSEGFPRSVIQYGRRPGITVNSIKLVPYKVSARSYYHLAPVSVQFWLAALVILALLPTVIIREITQAYL